MDGKEQEQTLFRKKAMERISSPEQLTEYLRVTNPGIWAVLAAVILLLAGIMAWSAVGTLETTADAKVVVSDQQAQVIAIGQADIIPGMPLYVSLMDRRETVIASVSTDDYGRKVGETELDLPDGVYDGRLVLERIHPIEFLLGSAGSSGEEAH